jgi:two-component system sensor histidine kinase TctE
MPESSRAPSIRGRLLAYLLLPLLLLMAVSAWLDHRTFVVPVYAAFDHTLSRTALEIAAHIERRPDGRLDVQWPPPGYGRRPHPADFAARRSPDGAMPHRPLFFQAPPFPGSPRFRPRDSFLFRVSRPDGGTLAGAADLPQAPIRHDDSGYLDAEYRGAPVRVLSLRTTAAGEPLVVSAAETMLWRNHVVRRLDAMIALGDGLQLLLVLAIAMFGITVALRPLRRLRERIVSRPPEALKPLPIGPVPGEVRPLVASLNGLLVTVRESAQAQQHFLTNAAHQLRTPLTGLKAQLEVLARESAGGPLQDRIAALHGGIERLAHTANQLLALARAEPTTRRAGDFTPLQLPELIGAVVSTMLDRALARGIDLGADCQPVQVDGVYWLLHELLVNLVDNAIRHTPPGGQVTVRCGADGASPFLEVEDDGPGIPPAERERVRERFYRAGDGQGSGLGLAIVEEIARSHRARLLILDGAGGGARMRVEFPAAR